MQISRLREFIAVWSDGTDGAHGHRLQPTAPPLPDVSEPNGQQAPEIIAANGCGSIVLVLRAAWPEPTTCHSSTRPRMPALNTGSATFRKADAFGCESDCIARRAVQRGDERANHSTRGTPRIAGIARDKTGRCALTESCKLATRDWQRHPKRPIAWKRRLAISEESALERHRSLASRQWSTTSRPHGGRHGSASPAPKWAPIVWWWVLPQFASALSAGRSVRPNSVN